MTNYSAAAVKSQTLVASTVDAVTLTSITGDVEVYNRTGTDPISFTTDGSTPTVLGDDCRVVGPGQALRVRAASTTVKLISAGANGYTVSVALASALVPTGNGYTVA